MDYAQSKLRGKLNPTLSFSYFVESFIDGIIERGFYGISIRYRKPSIVLVVGSGTYLIGFEEEKQNDEQLSMQTELEQR